MIIDKKKERLQSLLTIQLKLQNQTMYNENMKFIVNLILTTITGTALFLGSMALMPPPETGWGMFLYFTVIAYVSSYWLRRE